MSSDKCCVKNCQVRYKPNCDIHLFRFPFNDENRLAKWITAVKRPNWKPKKYSKICNLHFSRSDIIEGLGYRYVSLRSNAVPKDCSSSIAEQTDALLKSEEACNSENSKSESCSKLSIMRKNILLEHNYWNKNTCAITKNNELSTSVTESHRSIKKPILYLNKNQIAIEINPKEYAIMPVTQYVTSSSTSTDSGAKKDLSEQTVKKQSESLEKLKRQNETLKRKLKRCNTKITSMKKMFGQLQQKRLIDTNLLQLLRKHFEGITFEILQNEIKNGKRKNKDVRYTDEEIFSLARSIKLEKVTMFS